jgi:hypothetical protein
LDYTDVDRASIVGEVLFGMGSISLRRKINVPQGYQLARVPRDSRALDIEDDNHAAVDILYQYSPLKVLITLTQLLYSVQTLYSIRSHQLDRFGYAAFGLTVIPYLVMSFVNLVAGLLCPDFEYSYLVDSSILREANSRESASFPGIVGRLVEESILDIRTPDPGSRHWINVTTEVKPSLSSEKLKFILKSPSEAICFENTAEDDTRDEKDVRNSVGTQEIQDNQSTGKAAATSIDCEIAKNMPDHQDSIMDSHSPQLPIKSGELALPSQWLYQFDYSSTDEEEDLSESCSRLFIPFCPNLSRTTHPLDQMLSRLHLYRHHPFWKTFTTRFGLEPWTTPVIIAEKLLMAFINVSMLAIFGGISKFQKGGSSSAQRIWILSWIVLTAGHLYVLLFTQWLFCSLWKKPRLHFRWQQIALSGSLLVLWGFFVALLFLPKVISIGGMVVVGQELKALGICQSLG